MATDQTDTTPVAGEPAPDAPASDGREALTPPSRPRRRRAASRPAGPPVVEQADAVPPVVEQADAEPPVVAKADADAVPAAPKRTRRTRAKTVTAAAEAPVAEAAATEPAAGERPTAEPAIAEPATTEPATTEPATTESGAEPSAASAERPARRTRTTRRRKADVTAAEPTHDEAPEATSAGAAVEGGPEDGAATAGAPVTVPLFQAPDPEAATVRRRRRRAAASRLEEQETAAVDDDVTSVAASGEVGDEDEAVASVPEGDDVAAEATDQASDTPDEDEEDAGEDVGADEGGGRRRRRRRGGRRRRKGSGDEGGDEAGDGGAPAHEEPGDEAGEAGADDAGDGAGESGEPGDDEGAGSHRRRRRRRRGGSSDAPAPDDPPNTVVKVRAPRQQDVSALKGSTRLEAKKQRRREGREAGRRRAPILTEAEFLARREDVDRRMVVRQVGDRVQIAVLEDGVLVEHYVNNRGSQSLVGNVYLGRVQNVLPSMEAAFVDIGRGRNAVLYAGEVNWDAAGLDGQPKRIEFALKSGDGVLVQVTKDPLGHKGARLTSQISLPGRYLVLVPDGSMTGISRKLPDTERSRLKSVLRKVVPDDAGVIVRTAAEGASEEELSRDVSRLTAQWADIQKKAKTASPPTLLYGEPDLAIRVVRDIFNEDFSELIVAGPDVWETVEQYVSYVAPDLAPRLRKWVENTDVFSAYRIDEQLAKALDRKVWLPSGGSLVIDRTEAMTVVDVNTGKFTGQGGNLEETVTRNNLEAAEEIVRQLRLRDIGGIIVVDFIDMVLESNRDLVLRRLVECLARDRTKHQVAEVTSLGLVQMTRKRIGQGLLETFSEPCEHCNGRGLRIRTDPVEAGGSGAATPSNGGNGSGGGGGETTGRRRRGRRGAADPADVMAAALAARTSSDGEEEAPEPEGADVSDVTEAVEAVEVADLAGLAEPVEVAEVLDVSEAVEVLDVSEAVDVADLAEAVEVTEVAEVAEPVDVPAVTDVDVVDDLVVAGEGPVLQDLPEAEDTGAADDPVTEGEPTAV